MDNVLNVSIDVDTQHDFCDPTGALFVRGAERLSDTFRALTDGAIARAIPIVGSVDSHAFDAWEFAGAVDAGPNGERPGFPAHCVKGTAGWLKIPGTLATRARFVPNVACDDAVVEALVTKHEPAQILLEKEVYSLFANANAGRVLDVVTRNRPTRFVVYGVATDYCVRAAALGLRAWLGERNRAGEVWLVEDAIAAVDAKQGERAIAECAAAGVKIVRATDVLRVFAA